MSQHSFWIGKEGAATFMHAHIPSQLKRSIGVIIVPPLGHEYVHGYRAMRSIASAVAASGMIAIRPEFSGTGNSVESSELHVSGWLSDLERARDFLLSQPGVKTIAVLGIRSGALVAARHVRSGDKLVFWNPSTSGKQFLRELKALGRFSTSRSGNTIVESGGLQLSGQLETEIEQLQIYGPFFELTSSLLIEREDRKSDVVLVDTLSAASGQFDRLVEQEFDAAFCEPHNTKIPMHVTHQIVQWLANGMTAEAPESTPVAPCLAPDVIDNGSIRITSNVRESVISIDGLFAIHTYGPHSKSVLLIGNGGSAHHVGANRLNVLLARALAERGIDCLRYDLRNLGDSVDLQSQFEKGDFDTIPYENFPYPKSANADIDRVIHWALARGYEEVILAGLCSGACLAFNYAESVQGSGLSRIVMINPLTFSWEDGMSLEVPNAYVNLRQAKHYSYAMRDPNQWKRLLRGDIDYGLLVRHVAKRLGERSVELVQDTLVRAGIKPVPELAQRLIKISDGGIRMHFFFADRDPGLEILQTAGERTLENLGQHQRLRIECIEYADHTFKETRLRDELIARVVEDLSKESSVGS